MLSFRAASGDPADGELVRVLRNAGRQWMTRDARELTPDAQRAWWAQRDPLACPIWLAEIARTTVGYGLLRSGDDGRTWCSLAVAPRWRGHGFGAQIYRYLACAHAGETWAEILADNTPSIRACLRAGFQIAYAADALATLVYRP